MKIDEQLQALENNITSAKGILELGAALDRLFLNKDFKLVIKTGYFEKEAVRLVHLKGAPHMQTKEMQDSVIKQIDAISTLSDYLRVVAQQANFAVNTIESDELTREELLAEAIANG